MITSRRTIVFLLLVAAASLIPGFVSAEPLIVDDLRINGFISQGYINSSGNNFLSDSRDGTFEFNEVGLTINSKVNEKLRVGAQFLARDLGPVGNNEIRLDWGFADYHWHDMLGFRIGKAKMPMGLYNEGRDSDFLRPMVLLPQSIYDETKRDLLVAYQGGGIYGNIPLGFLGNMDYQGFFGSINIPDDSTLVTTMKGSASMLIKQPPLGGAPANMLTSFSMDNNYIGGGSIIINTKLNNIRLGASYFTVDNDMTFSYVNIAGTTAAPSTGTGSLRNKARTVYSVEIPIGKLTLSGEYGETDREQVIFGKTNVDGPSQEYYAMATFAVTDALSLSGLYDIYYNLKDDKDGKKFAAANLKPGYLAYRKDWGAGVRYDLNPNWTLKAEYHEVRGGALFMEAFNAGSIQRAWEYYSLKASFNF
jgi:hypothetical protein